MKSKYDFFGGGTGGGGGGDGLGETKCRKSCNLE